MFKIMEWEINIDNQLEKLLINSLIYNKLIYQIIESLKKELFHY